MKNKGEEDGTPGRIRTPDLLIRSQTLPLFEKREFTPFFGPKWDEISNLSHRNLLILREL